MCFSATASFVTAAVTGAAGLVALTRADRREDIALAATPLFFAVQQTIEGLLWLKLPTDPNGLSTSVLTLMFLILAKVLWPAFVPLAVFLVEPDRRRRQALLGFVGVGVAVALYFVWSVASHTVTSRIGDNHIVYGGEPVAPLGIQLAYFVVTGLTATLSSFRTLRVFAGIVLVGSVISYVFYWEAFSSVWCFFAAAASAVIVFHFERVRLLRRAAIPS
jgi:hypothetical protein